LNQRPLRVYDTHMMTPVRLLAVDLDDTLLRSDLSVSFRTRNAIRKAESRGVGVVLASSRTPAALGQFTALLGFNKKPGYVIANSGTVVQERRSGEIVYEQKIPAEAALLVFDMADAEGCAVQIYEGETMYISRANEFTGCDQKLTGCRQVVSEDFRAMVKAGCHKMLIPGDPMILEPLAQILGTLSDDAVIHAAKPYLLEVLPPSADRGSALALVAEKCSVPREAVLAVGTSLSDEPMLRWAGYPATLGNAGAGLKKIAALILEKTGDEDGVAELIERYILGNETLPGGNT